MLSEKGINHTMCTDVAGQALQMCFSFIMPGQP
jgi:hypothetical protein